jgi:hypothetical protein
MQGLMLRIKLREQVNGAEERASPDTERSAMPRSILLQSIGKHSAGPTYPDAELTGSTSQMHTQSVRELTLSDLAAVISLIFVRSNFDAVDFILVYRVAGFKGRNEPTRFLSAA